ncbi:MAG: glycosyl hydrolase, partial [Mariniphaga sp.]|nr:glycosyl hydrolase [Mariniphaga sp.]
MHPLETSMDIDIPECESWLGRGPTPANKYVASAAALVGKRLVSCEDITNTTRVFITTLEAVKMTGDQSMISGVTHSVLHGFNYSPPEAPFPGWVRYGTWFNERNTWWPYFRRWADYKARMSTVLQQAVPQANVAVLQPLNDLWLKHGLQRDPFPHKFYPPYQYEIWKAIHQNGGGCDYVSEKIINKSSFSKGTMNFNERSYQMLLLPEVETMEPETAQSVKNFAEAGGKIVFIGKIPFKSPGFTDHEKKDATVMEIMDNLLTQHKDKVLVYDPPGEDIAGWYGTLMQKLNIQPYVRFNQTHPSLSQCCFDLDGHQMFFIANCGLTDHVRVQADFNMDKNMIPWVWDPETGKKWRYPVPAGDKQIILELPRATSLLIVFEEDVPGEEFFPVSQHADGEQITGPWQVKLYPVNGADFELQMESLTDLINREETKDFAGTAIYEISFPMEAGKHHLLDLGDVQGTTELSLNGKVIGERWYGAHVYDIREAVKSGENKLSVKLTTITGNYLRTQHDNPVARRWVVYQPLIPMGMIGPVKLM